jgi:lauroyl/myristoyl acyltransferase
MPESGGTRGMVIRLQQLDAPVRRPPHAGRERPQSAVRRTGRSLRIRFLDVLVEVLPLVPRPLLVLVAELAGEVRYRRRPELAARVRTNLARVCTWLVVHDRATPRVRRAASDPRALEGLTRSAFRHHARTYLELLLAPSLSGEELERRLTVVDEPLVRETLRPGNRIVLVGLHLASIEIMAFVAARWTNGPATAPMETLADAELQAWIVETRASVGVRIVGLGQARRELLAALERGEAVGIVGDRDITGGGMPVELFGHPASLPIGAALLAVETATPVFAGAIRRSGRSRYVGELVPVELPAGGTRRDRVLAVLHGEARAFERLIAPVPDQWWSVFFPIWPDLEPGPSSTSRRRPEPDRPTIPGPEDSAA